VGVAVAPTGDGRLEATITARTNLGTPTNSLLRLDFAKPAVAIVDIPGGPSNQAAPFTYTPTAGTTSVSFFIRQQTPGQAATVPLTVVDTCGNWPTFVGGGAGTFSH
jgi:hypothetical protein